MIPELLVSGISAMGRFEETDRIDAEVIARFGAAKPLVANSAAEQGSE
jgi:hypothetical protein